MSRLLRTVVWQGISQPGYEQCRLWQHLRARHQPLTCRDRTLEQALSVRLVRMGRSDEVHRMFESMKIKGRSPQLFKVAALDLRKHLLDVRGRELVTGCGADDLEFPSCFNRRFGTPCPRSADRAARSA